MLIIQSMCAATLGIINGSVSYYEKTYAARHKKIWLGLLFTIVRFAVIFSIVYYNYGLIKDNAILLIAFFVSSYLCTIVLAYKK